MSFYLHVASIVLFIIVPSVTCLDQPYDGPVCLTAVNATYEGLYSRNPEYFSPGSNVSRPFLTLLGCESLCGNRWGPYPDVGPRLLDWIVPGILLIANLHFVPIGWKRYTVLAHFLGDPIDTMLCLLYLVEDWVANLRQAESIILDSLGDPPGFGYLERSKILATILSAAGRLLEPRDLSNLPTTVANWLTMGNNPELKTRYADLTEAAVALRHLRLHDIRRTGFAIFLYLFQFVVVFVYRIGGSPNPSGGRVSPAMMLSWFLPVVLLSNAIGDYGSWEHSQGTILRLLKKPREGLVGEASQATLLSWLVQALCATIIQPLQAGNLFSDSLPSSQLLFHVPPLSELTILHLHGLAAAQSRSYALSAGGYLAGFSQASPPATYTEIIAGFSSLPKTS
ncbi:hypothetical protein N431DRAFT_562912 [Stipitochalara longipes BDJ]|nr:hypothetical protein N431DRAFT_562912 [Stipitochalara longipes BDJ]